MFRTEGVGPLLRVGMSLAMTLPILLVGVVIGVLVNEAWTTVISVDLSRLPETLGGGRPLEEATRPELIQTVFRAVAPQTLQRLASERFERQLRSRARILGVEPGELSWDDVKTVLLDHLTRADLIAVLEREVLRPQIVASFTLMESLLHSERIDRLYSEIRDREGPVGRRVRRSWVFWPIELFDRTSSLAFRAEFVPTVHLWVLLNVLGFAAALVPSLALWLLAQGTTVRGLAPTAIGTLLMLHRRPSTLVWGVAFVLVLHSLGVSLAKEGFSWIGAALLALALIPRLVAVNLAAEKERRPSLLLSGLVLGLPESYVLSFLVLPARWRGYLARCLREWAQTLGETALWVVLWSWLGGAELLPVEVYRWSSLGLQRSRPLAASAALVFLVLVWVLQAVVRRLAPRR